MRRLQPTLTQAAAALRAGQVTSVALTEACLQRASETAPLNAFISVWGQEALEAARQSDKRRAAGQTLGPLDGIPVAAKDNFCTKGKTTTAGSKMLAGFKPQYDATVIARLTAGGAVMVGKTNQDEFGLGSATVFSASGPVNSPWTAPGTVGTPAALVAGGSSGGSAVAVATGAALGALGSDTGGSVRLPSAFCGVVGLKPTYGRVSRWGLIAYASSLDVPGLMGRSVSDVAMLLQCVAGDDGLDSTCLEKPLGPVRCGGPDVPGVAVACALTRALHAQITFDGSLQGVKIGIPAEFHVAELAEHTLQQWRKGIAWLEAAGAEIVSVSLPSVQVALPAYYIVACAEVASNLACYDGVRYGHRAPLVPDAGRATADAGWLHDSYTQTRSEAFGSEVQTRILVGDFVLSQSARAEYYDAAQRLRSKLCAEFSDAFRSVDVMLTPTTPTGAWQVGTTLKVDPTSMYLNDVMTVPVNLAGLPAISVPTGMAQALDGTPTPTALQLIGSHGGDEMMLRVAAAVERAANVGDAFLTTPLTATFNQNK